MSRGPWPLSWTEFLRALGVDPAAVTGPAPLAVNGAAYDSRTVRQGDAFFALRGTEQDGARFALQAAGSGAAVVVGEAPTGVRGTLSESQPPAEVIVGEARKALAEAAVALYRDPSKRLMLIGLTGTNGKTTGAFLCRAILTEAGIDAGMVGTAGYYLGAERRDAPHTTPEAPDLCDLLDTMSAQGLKAAVLEVSSHALALRRTYGLSFQSVVFTNLTRDHLDFHGDETRYLAAKLRLFNGENGGDTKVTTAVVNASDPHAPTVLAACAAGGMRALRFAVEGSGPAGRTCWRRTSLWPLVPLHHRRGRRGARDLLPARRPTSRTRSPQRDDRVRRAARGCVGARELAGVPAGSLLDRGQEFTVLVDYAHTPDALARVLTAVRETLPQGARLAVVFGCGGDRDRGKRAAMGEAAALGADLAIVTDDNPRHENPAVIRGEAMKGAEAVFAANRAPRGAARPVEIAGRRRAIEHALAWAKPGDAVLLAGKGHEGVQIVGAASVPFDDRLEAARALDALGQGK